jgi:hypothetical protein
MKVLITLAATAAMAFAASPAMAEMWDGSSNIGPLGTPNPQGTWSGPSGSHHDDNVLNPDTWVNFGGHGSGSSQYCLQIVPVVSTDPEDVVPQKCDSANPDAVTVFSGLYTSGYINPLPGCLASLPDCDGTDGEPGGVNRNGDHDSLGGLCISTTEGQCDTVNIADEEGPS